MDFNVIGFTASYNRIFMLKVFKFLLCRKSLINNKNKWGHPIFLEN